MIRNPAYDGSSEEDEEIDPVDITPLISSLDIPIVTAPAENEKGIDERVEVGVEDEDEDDTPPGLKTDESSSIGDEGSAVGEMRQDRVDSRSEDEEDHNGWDPPTNLLTEEYQFPNATAVLGYFPSATSPVTTSPRQLPQQQFPQQPTSPTTISPITNFPNNNFPNNNFPIQ